jgi:hypothetical protein
MTDLASIRAFWGDIEMARLSMELANRFDNGVMEQWWEAVAEITVLEDSSAEAARFKARVLQIVCAITGDFSPASMLALSLARDLLAGSPG